MHIAFVGDVKKTFASVSILLIYWINWLNDKMLLKGVVEGEGECECVRIQIKRDRIRW